MGSLHMLGIVGMAGAFIWGLYICWELWEWLKPSDGVFTYAGNCGNGWCLHMGSLHMLGVVGMADAFRWGLYICWELWEWLMPSDGVFTYAQN
ncbi:hypothetical protein ACJMK2_006485 [Sinanodonta woodiana]|uniref:Uncharacterized protein n=1 Tax=Sinanodonta woodiana TaxID=1069815 RepID=A0ABD3VWS3_SINWO